MAGDQTSSTQNVLDMMTAGIMGRKAQAAAKLTPVTSEVVPTHTAGPLSGEHNTMFPYDDPQTILHALAAARMQIEHVLTGIEVLEKLYSPAPKADPKADPAAERKAAERAADERIARQKLEVLEGGKDDDDGLDPDDDDIVENQSPFNDLPHEAPVAEDLGARMARLSKEAQDAAYSKSAKAAGWACPSHGADKTAVKTSRLNRQYRACTECKEFEKL